MDLDTAIKTRRSVRRFSDRPVPEDQLRLIVEAGNSAPSACNFQAWRFRILTAAQKHKMVKLGGADIIANAPLVIMVFYPKTDNPYHDGIQSASACIQNMLLTATSLGIGSCWICHLPMKTQVKQLFSAPFHYEPVACVLLGYPAGAQVPMKRKFSFEELFEFGSKSYRNILKYFYTRLPFRPKIVERLFTKRFPN